MNRLLCCVLVSLFLLVSCADEQSSITDSLTVDTPMESLSESTTDRLTETTVDVSSDTEFDEWETMVETEPETERDPAETSDDETEKKEEDEPWTEPPVYHVDGYVYRIDIRPYLSYIVPKNEEEYLLLVNRNHTLSSDYQPSDLTRTKANYDKKLRQTACYALNAMFAEMKALGVCDTKPQSAYRSYATQMSVYNSYLKTERKRHPTYTEEQIVALVQQYSAPPGASDHQTGLAVDFSPISSSFQSTKAFAYLTKNAHKFGFILRFPKGKTDITGYMYESWHWRFVGRKAATEIYERGITLEEYLEELYGGIIPPEIGESESDSTSTDTTIPDMSQPDDTTSETLSGNGTEEVTPPDTDADHETDSNTDTDADPPETDTDSSDANVTEEPAIPPPPAPEQDTSEASESSSDESRPSSDTDVSGIGEIPLDL